MALPLLPLVLIGGGLVYLATRKSTPSGGGSGGGSTTMPTMTCDDYINAMPVPEAQKQVMRLALKNPAAVPEQLQAVANEIRKQSAVFPYAESLAKCFEMRATELKPS